LVVIAIIALLMSILTPALARVRKQAKAILCLSNLRQWGVCFTMYTEDHGGFFNAGWPSVYSNGALMEWINSMRSYYDDNPDFRCCPTATIPVTDGGRMPFAAWGTYDFVWFEEPSYGSYGINGYAHNPPLGKEAHNRPPGHFWRTRNVKGGTYIPLFLDAQRFDGWPLQTDEPPLIPGLYFAGISGDQMRRYCLDRHNGFVNTLFLDFNARKVGLKELWRLEWHRGYRENDPSPTAWDDHAHWMHGMKDYYLE
jgi:type II secretory pathway pseudopilin PulG